VARERRPEGLDSRVKCLVFVVGVRSGARCTRSVRRLTNGTTSARAPDGIVSGTRWRVSPSSSRARRSWVVDKGYGRSPGEADAIPSPWRKVADLIRI
jgi:hypothetical protein